MVITNHEKNFQAFFLSFSLNCHLLHVYFTIRQTQLTGSFYRDHNKTWFQKWTCEIFEYQITATQEIDILFANIFYNESCRIFQWSAWWSSDSFRFEIQKKVMKLLNKAITLSYFIKSYHFIVHLQPQFSILEEK